jgi:hypothetical protein
MSPFNLFYATLGATAALLVFSVPQAQAQAVIDEPGYCAFFYPNANCDNLGPGNPYTDPHYRHTGDQTIGSAPTMTRHHRRHHRSTSAASRTQ